MVGSSGGKKRRKVSGGTVEVGGSYDHVYQCVDMEVLTVESLYHLLNRAVAMCFPQADQSPFHAHLVSVTTNSRTLLQPYPIDTHALGSPQMQLRGEVCRSCFRNFVTTLGEHSQFYAPPPTDMAAIQTKSLRLPPGEDTFTRQSRQAGSLFALRSVDVAHPSAADEGTSSSSESDGDGPHVAAFESTGGGRRGDTDRSFTRGPGRHDRDQRAGRYAAGSYSGDKKRGRYAPDRKRDRNPLPPTEADAPSRDS